MTPSPPQTPVTPWPRSTGQVSGSNILSTLLMLCCQAMGYVARNRHGRGHRCRQRWTQTHCRRCYGCGHGHSSRLEPGMGGVGQGGTHILHALDVGLDLLQHTGVTLCLLGTPHALVDAFSHLLDAALRIQQERVVRVVLRRVLQEVLGWEWAPDLCLAAPVRPWGPTVTAERGGTGGRLQRGLPFLPDPCVSTKWGPQSPLHPHMPAGFAHLPTQPHAHLHQKLIAWDPLHGLDHEVGQCLLLLVLTHALLKPKTGWMGTQVRNDMQRWKCPGTGPQQAPPAQPEGRR